MPTKTSLLNQVPGLIHSTKEQQSCASKTIFLVWTGDLQYILCTFHSPKYSQAGQFLTHNFLKSFRKLEKSMMVFALAFKNARTHLIFIPHIWEIPLLFQLGSVCWKLWIEIFENPACSSCYFNSDFWLYVNASIKKKSFENSEK